MPFQFKSIKNICHLTRNRCNKSTFPGPVKLFYWFENIPFLPNDFVIQPWIVNGLQNFGEWQIKWLAKKSFPRIITGSITGWCWFKQDILKKSGSMVSQLVCWGYKIKHVVLPYKFDYQPNICPNEKWLHSRFLYSFLYSFDITFSKQLDGWFIIVFTRLSIHILLRHPTVFRLLILDFIITINIPFKCSYTQLDIRNLAR